MLVAASDVFAELGTDASVAQIAARAGMGKATVFGHFPSKETLLTAIVTDEVDRLVAAGEQLPGDLEPGPALLAFMKLQVDRYAANRAFIEILREAGAAERPEIRAQVERLAEACRPLIRRAQESGAARSDLSALDVVLLACGVYSAAESLLDHEPGACERYLHAVFEGIATTSG
ncbi:TetR/AcrR family transcriptional regulator [Actinacidiphila guanduensis]|uniref:TetR/AcrR family transcriptional regulator n=1 Tax=Actinacidiphila guanduensis TaxID=310781 RepID=UPI0015A3BA49|nr:TetR/AcrR family transcriptional regulator [Actinacidiphila guanduensis]